MNRCLECGSDAMEYEAVDNCSCHLWPPCAACTSAPLVCGDCGTEHTDEYMHDRCAEIEAGLHKIWLARPATGSSTRGVRFKFKGTDKSMYAVISHQNHFLVDDHRRIPEHHRRFMCTESAITDLELIVGADAQQVDHNSMAVTVRNFTEWVMFLGGLDFAKGKEPEQPPVDENALQAAMSVSAIAAASMDQQAQLLQKYKDQYSASVLRGAAAPIAGTKGSPRYARYISNPRLGEANPLTPFGSVSWPVLDDYNSD